MKILVLTSIRSEYDLLSPLLFKLDADPSIDLKLLVGGAHNSPTFGNTFKDIKNDGFEVLCHIESLIDADSKSSRLKSASILLLSMIDVVKSYSPDLLIYAGDREEVLIGGMLGGYLSIPTVHFFGGDHSSDGHIDNPVRHATSKLSTCHMVSTQLHSDRLRAIGEPICRIFNIGSIALDKFVQAQSIDNIAETISGKKIDKKIALLIYHPIANEIGKEKTIIKDAITALVDSNYHIFIGSPNSDPGNSHVRDAILQASNDNPDCTVYGNLPRDLFISLFKSSSIIVGNSSAGILEAASIPIPCINIGERQRGRYCGENVIFVDSNYKSIKKAISIANHDEFKRKIVNLKNPYGDGNSADKAYNLIKTIDFQQLINKKEDPLELQA
ncbi:UDP-N-acetylglucosamine 2-epimerase [Psychrobacter namhaensis]|uniref:UDP-N-acetylglucosamine 2-epimerase n=1 Tax=Psychrobacter namhaensis TaxID=292734 RepID=UPI003CFCBE4C